MSSFFLAKKFEAAVDLSDSGDLEDPFRAKKVSQNKMAEIAFFWRENMKQVFK